MHSNSSPPDNFMILRHSLTHTAHCFSLEHSLDTHRYIDQAIIKKEGPIKKLLDEFTFDKTGEHMNQYCKEGVQQLTQLTQYYRYYTQTSISYLPAFYKVMHNYREQRKAIEYNRLKVMLQLSTSTHTDSSNPHPKLENTIASSFRLLSMLKLTNNNEESQLVRTLKDKLQQDYGPSKYNTLEQIDKHFKFGKNGAERINTRISNKKSNKNQNTPTNLFKNKTIVYRNSSCALLSLNSTRKESRAKTNHNNRKKNASMDNVNSSSGESTLSHGQKMTKSQVKPDSREMEIKKKIMGFKDQIRREKILLLRHTETPVKSKKTLVQGRLTRKLRQ